MKITVTVKAVSLAATSVWLKAKVYKQLALDFMSQVEVIHNEK